jgi:hypothetical protein
MTRRVVILALLAGYLPGDFRISRLRFASLQVSRLKFAWVSHVVVCDAGPGSGLY